MRRIPLILGLVLITGLIIHGIYEFVVTNEGIRYFLSEPMRLAYAVLLGVAGGIVAFGVSRLSPASQRNVKLLALGGFGLFAAVFLCGCQSPSKLGSGDFDDFLQRSGSSRKQSGDFGAFFVQQVTRSGFYSIGFAADDRWRQPRTPITTQSTKETND